MMLRLWRALIGRSRRERHADEIIHRREEDHEIAMHAVRERVAATERAAQRTETAAASLLRRLREDIPR